MAWTSGFFNSVNGDRTYNAKQMSEIFEGLITDGVYESVGNKMAVQPNSSMTIQIATGRGWFGKHWVNNDSEYLHTLEASDVLLNRYCAVCIRVDDTDSVRDAVPYFKYSEFATSPVKPTMTRTETVKEYCLAYVYIRAGAATITASDIEDTRGNNNLCGWVTGLIEQLSTTTLFSQWESIFNDWFVELQNTINGWRAVQEEVFTDWFENLQDNVNENTETMLVAAVPTNLSVTLSAGGWAWNAAAVAFTQDITVTGMTDTKSVIIQPDTASETAYSAAEVRCHAQGTNTLTFAAVSQPTEDVTVKVLHMGV